MIRHEVRIRTSNGRKSILIDDAFCNSLSVPVGDENMRTVALFITSWVTLLADSPLNPGDKPFRLFRDFLSDIREHGIKTVVIRFTDLAHQLVSQHSLMGSGSSKGDWIDGFKDTPVFFEYNRYYRTGDVKLLDFLYTFLNFGKKLDYVDESFNSVAFCGWLDVENKLRDLVLDPADLSALRLILKTCLVPFSFDKFYPKFGPGSVAERGVRGRIGKIRNFPYDSVLDRVFFRGHIGMYGSGEDHGLRADRVIPDPSTWSPAREASSRMAWLIFRKKNLKVARSVCMEPNLLMYFQQGCMRRVQELIGQSLLTRFINVSKQDRNRYLALQGSLTSEVDTLDLSSASDSVSLDLVKAVFPPSWLIPMLATRSSSVRTPDGSVRILKKFAPMGSALCFPTQCIIFASVCIYAACKYLYDVTSPGCDFLTWLTAPKVVEIVGKFSDDVGYLQGSFQPLAVYGDDICVDRRLTDEVKSILDRLGFSVNHGKSFTGSQSFRESCGGYYLDGHDITPLYFTVEGVKKKLSASHVASQVQLTNKCYLKKYVNTYRFLRRSLVMWGIGDSASRETSSFAHPIPYVSDPESFGILCNTPENSHLQKRLHVAYQRDEVRSWALTYEYFVPAGDLFPAVDRYEYMRWWASRGDSLTTESYDSVSRHDTGGARLCWRWIPA
jgi:hypothetical protein